MEDKELSSNSGSEFSFLNSHGPTEWKDDGDKSSALLAEHNLTEISSLATTNTSQNGDVEYAGCETKILKQFCDWLVSPDGEQKDKKTATQHVSQLKRVMSVTGGGPASLVDEKKIRDVFLPQAKDKYHAATIKSYLMSLQHYCSFLLEDKPSGADYDRDEVTDLPGKLKKWSASYKRETTRRRWERQEEDVTTLTTPDKSEGIRAESGYPRCSYPFRKTIWSALNGNNAGDVHTCQRLPNSSDYDRQRE